AITITASVGAAPTITLTNPPNAATFAPGATLPITAAAADSDGQVTQVEFFVNGVSVAKVGATPYATSFTLPSVGTYNIFAIATDNSGNHTASPTITVTGVAGAPPTVAITEPVNGAVFAPGTPLTVTANAADSDGNVRQVQFFVNGAPLGAPVTS